MLTEEEEDRFRRVVNAYPREDCALLLDVFYARDSFRGMAKAKANWIISCCLQGQPKIGWRDEAREAIATLG